MDKLSLWWLSVQVKIVGWRLAIIDYSRFMVDELRNESKNWAAFDTVEFERITENTTLKPIKTNSYARKVRRA